MTIPTTPDPPALVGELRASATGVAGYRPIDLLNRAASTIESQAAELTRLRGALQEIAEPVAAMDARAEAEGYELNGTVAVSLGNSASYLQSIARRALGGG